MKKLDNFSNCLRILEQADFQEAATSPIYRTGVVGQFNLTFELAWKAMQQVLQLHGVVEAATGSPREILQLGYKVGFLQQPEVWLDMLKKRHQSVHLYNEEEVDALIQLVKDSFISAFQTLEKTLLKKLQEAES